MSRLFALRALVTERLSAAAQEIFALVERTIAEYEEELCRSKEENQRKQQLLDAVLVPRVRTEAAVQMDLSSESRGSQEIPKTPQIKEEPEEQRLKQEEEQLPECTAVCVKSEEHREWTQGEHCGRAGADISSDPHLNSEEQTDNSSDSDNEDWAPPARSSTAPMETEADGDHYNQVQRKDTSPAAHNSGLFSKYKCGAESRAAVPEGHGADEAEEAGGGSYVTLPCPFCLKIFTSEESYETHISVHTDVKPYTCTICDKTFSTKGNRHTHMKIHRGEKPHSCLICVRAFVSSSALKVHMRCHTGERPYSCAICDKTFGHKTALNDHMRTHTGDKPFSCSICKKEFTKKGNCDSHMRRHLGEKPYSCSVCDKAFAVSSALSVHMRTHTGEKPYSCPTCAKAFVCRSALTVHIRTHTGDKPYSCSVCDKKFMRKGHLETHLRTHTPFSCSTCGGTFLLKHDLIEHMKNHCCSDRAPPAGSEQD